LSKFAIHISTKNRRDDLRLTLDKIAPLLSDDVSCRVIDDGSIDGTFDLVQMQFPMVSITRNDVSKGYIHCRNKMLNEETADYAISLDDDAHFITENPTGEIESYFLSHPDCGLIAFRIFWGKTDAPKTTETESPIQVKSYVGCGHAWRMRAWHAIPNYPEWFEFYGEEHFGSLQLFRQNMSVDYLPSVFVQHRVDMQARKQNASDSNVRFRNSLRADWYNYFLFYPVSVIPKKMAYSLKSQFAQKIFKGNAKLIFPLFGAIWDLIRNAPKIMRHRNSLSSDAYRIYMKLPPAKIFWKP
jgi:glycosyltransferase involved in cell wall biosynthesis